MTGVLSGISIGKWEILIYLLYIWDCLLLELYSLRIAVLHAKFCSQVLSIKNDAGQYMVSKRETLSVKVILICEIQNIKDVENLETYHDVPRDTMNTSWHVNDMFIYNLHIFKLLEKIIIRTSLLRRNSTAQDIPLESSQANQFFSWLWWNLKNTYFGYEPVT